MNQGKWIWHDKNYSANEYVDFSKEFTIDFIDKTASLSISVDTEYAVWLNGTILGCCQYDDYPDSKVFDNYEVSKLLKPGKNELVIQVYYQGIESFQYAIGTPRALVLPDKRHSLCRQ